MNSTSIPQGPHRRYNPLLDEWVLCSPHRMKRPWQGQQDPPTVESPPRYDPNCYLCPGNKRIGGEKNPEFTGPFVFTNDFAALTPAQGQTATATRGGKPALVSKLPSELFQVESQRGICKVICFSPRHDLTLASMQTAEITNVVNTWAAQEQLLAQQTFIHYVQVFENKGAAMGCSNPHPHCQIWASEHTPEKPRRRLRSQEVYFQKHNRDLLGDYLMHERRLQQRIVCENEHFTALVPFWAVWPFEVMVVARRHANSFAGLSEEEREGLADLMRRVCVRYDNLFECSFPYSMGFYTAPTDKEEHPYARFHAEYYPPLLRSASVRKFLVGYEMTADPQRDLTAERAAGQLRSLSETRFA